MCLLIKQTHHFKHEIWLILCKYLWLLLGLLWSWFYEKFVSQNRALSKSLTCCDWPFLKSISFFLARVVCLILYTLVPCPAWIFICKEVKIRTLPAFRWPPWYRTKLDGLFRLFIRGWLLKRVNLGVAHLHDARTQLPISIMFTPI